MQLRKRKIVRRKLPTCISVFKSKHIYDDESSNASDQVTSSVNDRKQMRDTDFSVGKQLEFYSNTIIAFLVFQGITFCYQFGTNMQFYNILRTDNVLAKVLAVMFLLVLVGAFYTTRRIAKTLEKFANESEKLIVRNIFIGKLIIILLFGVLPLFVSLAYTACLRTP